MGEKDKTTAGILALLVGGFGVHKFYLGKIGQGILYLLFFWTFIPAIIGFIEGIIYLTMDEDEFQYKYGTPGGAPARRNKPRRFCPSCGMEIEPDFNACPHCGEHLAKGPAVNPE